MAWNIGINFRATAGYVADGPGETYSVADAYPVTRGGATFGWTVLPSSGRDRDSSQDRRLAGINQMLNGTGVAEFRLDLPSPGRTTSAWPLATPCTGRGRCARRSWTEAPRSP